MTAQNLIFSFIKFLQRNKLIGIIPDTAVDHFLRDNKIRLNDIRNSLLVLPERIVQERNSLVDLQQQKGENEFMLKQHESKMAIDIESELDKDKKKKYSSKEKRDRELSIRKQDDDAYILIAKEVKEFKNKVTASEHNLEFFKNQLRAAESISRLGV